MPKAKLKRVRQDTTKHKKMEEMLQGQKDLYRAIMENDYFGVTLIDSNYKIVLVNKRISGYFHKPASELIGRECFREFEKRDSICPHCPGTQAMATGQPADVETIKVRDDGSHFSACIQAFPTFGPDGNVMGFIEIAQDVTEHKKAEQALWDSEARLRSFQDSATDGLLVFDSRLNLTDVNKAALEILGVNKRDMIGKNILEISPDVKTTGRYDKYLEVLRTGKPCFIDDVVPHPKFRDRCLSLRVFKVGDGLGIIGTDITERKKAEHALQESEEKYRNIFENAREAIITIDLKGNITGVNKLVEEYGFKREELIGKSQFEFITEQYRAEAIKKFEDLVRGGTDEGEIELITPRGNVIVEFRDNPIKSGEEIVGVQTILTDITERKRAEQVIRRERDRAQKYLDVAAAILVAIDVEQRVGLINKKGCQILGYSEDEILGKNWFNNFLPERIRGEVKEIFDKVLAGQTDGPEYYENPVLTKNGDERLIGWHNTILKDDKGDVIATLSSGEDITEHKKAEEALRESEEKYRDLVENMTDVIYTLDTIGNVTSVNEAHKKVYGFEPGEIIGRNFAEWIPKEQLPNAMAVFKRILSGQNVIAETILVDKERKPHNVEFSSTPIIKDGKVAGARGIIRDITERKKAEEKLLEDQKQLKILASQLTLAEERERRRIATEFHDRISQSLVISKIKLEGLQKSDLGKDMGSVLDDVCKTLGETINETRTLTFDLSSPILYELGFEDAVAEWLIEELQGKHGIKTEFEDDGQNKPLDDDIRILLFRNVRELLFNVVKHSQAKKVKVSISKVDNYIQITVEDDGVGFEPAEVATKAAQKGGFGLFSIRQRLEQLGGYFKIETKPGCGCRITMTAPLKRDVVRKAGDGPPPPHSCLRQEDVGGDAGAGQKA